MIARLLPVFLALVAFVTTLVILNWPSEQATGQTAAAPAARATARPQSQQPLPAAEKSLVDRFVNTFVPKRGEQKPAPSTSQPEEQDNTATVSSDPRQIGPDPTELNAPALIQLDPATAESGQIATFTNTGGKRMTFTVSTVDSNGSIRSSIEVTTPPHKRQVLNELGLVISPGDKIVVQSPPYKDYSVSAY